MVAEINLLPKKEKKPISTKLYIILTTSVFSLFAVILAFSFISSKQENTRVNTELNRLQADTALLQKQVDQATSSKAGSREYAVQFTEAVTYPVSPIILEVNTALPKHAYLRQYKTTEQSVTFHADFEDTTKVSQFVSKLQSSPLIADVKVDKMSSFVPVSGETDKDDKTEKFEAVPRYSTEFTIDINSANLKKQGEKK